MSHRRTKPPGQQRSYGLLVGKIKDGRMDPSGRSPHYEIWVSAGQDYRIAVNVQSVDGSDVLAYFDANFIAPTKLNLPDRAASPAGFTNLRTGPGGQGLDYLRDNLFPLEKMSDIPGEGSGITLANLLDAHIEAQRPIPSRSSWRAASFSRTPAGTRRLDFLPRRASTTFT